MIFEQLFDTKSSTYTYILSSGEGREALIIDPVIEHTEEYIKLLEKLKLKSVCMNNIALNFFTSLNINVLYLIYVTILLIIILVQLIT